MFCDITPYSPLNVNRGFGGTCYLHLQGRRINQTINQYEAGSKQNSATYNMQVSYLASFDPEDGGDMFLRNIGCLSTDYTALYLRRHKSSG
jgi:hypothetical protein